MKSIIALIGIIIFFTANFIFPTTINGRFVTLGISGSKYNILLQINTNTGSDDLGGLTIVFGFDTTAITYKETPIRNVDYIFHNFSGGNYSPASVTRPSKNRIWVNIYLPFINCNNGTVVSASPQWTDVVTIKFDIVDVNRPLGLSWFLASPFWGIYDADNITLWQTGIFDGNFGLEVEINNGWNLVSVPGLHPTNQNVETWWPYLTGTVWGHNGVQYVCKTVTTPGEGYWMNHHGNRVYNTGDEWPAGGIQRVPHYPITVSAGWNLIGGYETAVATTSLTTTPPGLISSSIYTYSNQYQIATSLEPGRGYLVRLSGSGQINMTDGLLAKGNSEVINYIKEDWGKIVLTDASARSFVLYLVNDQVDLNLFELPPMPPEGAFDIRFASGRIAEDLNYGTQALLMSGIIFPIKVQVENVSISLQDQSGNKINADLIPGEEITITNESINKLLILSDKSEAPITYYLEQNFPNPFNPTTRIKFAVPWESNVSLSIYNVLGELVSTLVSEHLQSGSYEYEFNASNLSSGIYIYRIKAGDFIETKKMVLLR